jgi:hypothetical protein
LDFSLKKITVKVKFIAGALPVIEKLNIRRGALFARQALRHSVLLKADTELKEHSTQQTSNLLYR